MICKNCGREIDDDKLACPYCGTPVNHIEADVVSEEIQSTKPAKREMNNEDKTALAFSLVGLIAWYIPIAGYIIGGFGIANAIKAHKKDSRSKIWIIALILSVACLAASLVNNILEVIMGIKSDTK